MSDVRSNLRIELTPPETLSRFQDIITTIVELHGGIGEEGRKYLVRKAEELGVHQYDFEQMIASRPLLIASIPTNAGLEEGQLFVPTSLPTPETIEALSNVVTTLRLPRICLVMTIAAYVNRRKEELRQLLSVLDSVV